MTTRLVTATSTLALGVGDGGSDGPTGAVAAGGGGPPPAAGRAGRRRSVARRRRDIVPPMLARMALRPRHPKVPVWSHGWGGAAGSPRPRAGPPPPAPPPARPRASRSATGRPS